MLRHSCGATSAADDLQIDDLTLDITNRVVQCAGQPLPRLTYLECRLLHTLMLHSGKTMLVETLIEHVWGYTGEGDRNMLRKLVNRLRAKTEPDPRQPRYVMTGPGVGYRFNAKYAARGLAIACHEDAKCIIRQLVG